MKQKPSDRTQSGAKTSSTETGRVAGQLGGLYTEERAKSARKAMPTKKNKTRAKPPEQG